MEWFSKESLIKIGIVIGALVTGAGATVGYSQLGAKSYSDIPEHRACFALIAAYEGTENSERTKRTDLEGLIVDHFDCPSVLKS